MCLIDDIITDKISPIIAETDVSELEADEQVALMRDLDCNYVVFEKVYSVNTGKLEKLLVYAFSDTEDLTINVLFEEYWIHPNQVTYTYDSNALTDEDEDEETEDYF
jgi:hypothetical protein